MVMAQLIDTDLSASKNVSNASEKGRQLDGQVVILMPNGQKLGIEITVSESLEHPKSQSGKDRWFISTKKRVDMGDNVLVGITGTFNCDGFPDLLDSGKFS